MSLSSVTNTSSASTGHACSMPIPLPSLRTRGGLGDFEHLSAAASHCILCRAAPRFSPRRFSTLPSSPAWRISEHRCSQFAIQGDPELQTRARQRKLQCRKDAYAAMVLKVVTIPWPREPHISEDTARHVGRNSLLFVNCWKLVVWILLWRNKLGRNQVWHFPNFTASHLHVTPNVL